MTSYTDTEPIRIRTDHPMDCVAKYTADPKQPLETCLNTIER